MKTLQREAGIKNPFAKPKLKWHARPLAKQRIRNANRQEQKRGRTALKRQLVRQLAEDQAEFSHSLASQLHLVPTAFKSMFQ